jgi:hypothetical protein
MTHMTHVRFEASNVGNPYCWRTQVDNAAATFKGDLQSHGDLFEKDS